MRRQTKHREAYIKIRDLLHKGGAYTTDEIQRQTLVKSGTLENALRELMTNRLVTRDEDTRPYRYSRFPK